MRQLFFSLVFVLCNAVAVDRYIKLEAMVYKAPPCPSTEQSALVPKLIYGSGRVLEKDANINGNFSAILDNISLKEEALYVAKPFTMIINGKVYNFNKAYSTSCFRRAELKHKESNNEKHWLFYTR